MKTNLKGGLGSESGRGREGGLHANGDRYFFSRVLSRFNLTSEYSRVCLIRLRLSADTRV